MKEVITNFISTYGADVIINIVVVITILGIKEYLNKRDKNKRVRKVLYKLVEEAELYLATKTGQDKKTQVIDWFLARYKFLSLFVNKDTLSSLIDEEAGKLKDYLAEGITEDTTTTETASEEVKTTTEEFKVK